MAGIEAANVITLTPEQAGQLQELVAKGRFLSTEDALEHSFALLLQEADDLPRYTPEAVAHVHSGIQQALRGEFVPEQEVEEFFADWERELSRRSAIGSLPLQGTIFVAFASI